MDIFEITSTMIVPVQENIFIHYQSIYVVNFILSTLYSSPLVWQNYVYIYHVLVFFHNTAAFFVYDLVCTSF